jgi:hypothetical protein
MATNRAMEVVGDQIVSMLGALLSLDYLRTKCSSWII